MNREKLLEKYGIRLPKQEQIDDIVADFYLREKFSGEFKRKFPSLKAAMKKNHIEKK
jgi:hypothetical protein